MEKGKEKCEMLKAIRMYVAEKYGLEYTPSECSHQGECQGTCPRCDAELAELQRQLAEHGITDITQDSTLSEMVEKYVNLNTDVPTHLGSEERPLEGVPYLEDTEETLEGLPHPPLEGEIIPKHEPQYEYKLILSCPVAGVGFHDIEETWDELYEGAKLALVRERNNKYDKNAVAVALADDYDGDPDNFDFDFIIGYIPRKNNAVIAAMLDMGWQELLKAEITELKDDAPYSDMIHMAVYLRSQQPVQPKDERLHILGFEDEEWEAFTEEMWQKGYTYQRWGKLLPDVEDLPEVGDMVVFIHPEKDENVIYLMKTIAEGEDQVKHILSHEEELDYADDCSPYVLTVVKGPVTFTDNELKFLGSRWKGHRQPDFKLRQKVSERLTDMIKNNG